MSSQRPRYPSQRWLVTHEALRSVLARPGLFDGPIDVPAVGNNPPTQLASSGYERASLRPNV